MSGILPLGPPAPGVAGPTGPAGADGRTVLSGTGAPGAGLGVNGDFYVNTAAWTIYGPKTAGAWGSPTSLVGPTGPAGNTILNGTGAPGGGVGVNGDFYLRTDTSQLYGPKAAGAWPGSPVSLIGPPGPTGARGITWKGAWSSITAYVVDDGVTSAGSTYRAILGHTNQAPPNVTYWELVASKGDPGPTGLTGPTGAAGIPDPILHHSRYG